jgi:hypothetical protein
MYIRSRNSKYPDICQLFFGRDICTAKFALDLFLALTWQYDLISFTFRAGALEIQNRADNGLKDDTHQVSPIFGLKKRLKWSARLTGGERTTTKSFASITESASGFDRI